MKKVLVYFKNKNIFKNIMRQSLYKLLTTEHSDLGDTANAHLYRMLSISSLLTKEPLPPPSPRQETENLSVN